MQHLQIIGSVAWVYISKLKRKKLDEWFWQGVFVGYEGKNQYGIYNLCIGTIHVSRDVKIDEENLSDKFSVSRWKLADDY